MNGRRRLTPGVASAIVVILVLCVAAMAFACDPSALAQSHQHGMWHVGNQAQYPDFLAASRAHRRKARSLRLNTLRTARRLDTVDEATREGYVADANLSPLYRPGLQHFRKNAGHYWGRVLNSRKPQALVFWCPSLGACRLGAFVYRAPARKTPPTYGGLLGWHRHHERTSWMTHVWLTNTTAPSLAQCAPFNAMRDRDPLLAWEPYKPDVPMIDEPCADTTGLADSPQSG